MHVIIPYIHIFLFLDKYSLLSCAFDHVISMLRTVVPNRKVSFPVCGHVGFVTRT